MSDLPATDVNPTDSSPVAVVEAPIAELTREERQVWRKTGTKPTWSAKTATPDTSTSDAASSPAAPADPAESTDSHSTPASEPGTPTRKKQNAESRKAELDAEIQDRLTRRRQLEQEIAEYEARAKVVKGSETVPPSHSPASPTSAEFPEFDDWLAIPGNESKGLGAYTKAAIAHDRAVNQVQERAQQTKATKIQTYAARMQEVAKEDPQWTAKVAPEILALKALDHLTDADGPPTMANIVAQEILESSAPYQVQRHLTDHPDEFRALVNASAPADVIRRIAAIAASASTSSVSATPSAVKTTTDAPPPPPQIGSRPHTPDDELMQAARSGDFRRYRDTANAADIARMRATGRR